MHGKPGELLSSRSGSLSVPSRHFVDENIFQMVAVVCCDEIQALVLSLEPFWNLARVCYAFFRENAQPFEDTYCSSSERC